MNRYLYVLIIGVSFTHLVSCSAYDANQRALSVRCEKLRLQGTRFVGCDSEAAYMEARRLAEAGDANALFILGRIYELGGKDFNLPEIREDFNAAKQYYLKAARLGNADAEEAIAFIYLKWYRNTREPEGRYWQCVAATNGNLEAKLNIQNEMAYEQLNDSIDNYCVSVLKKGEPKD